MKTEILQHYKGYEVFIKQLDEALMRYQKTLKPVPLHFLNMDEMEVATRFLGEQAPYLFVKGYEDAMSGRLIIGESLTETDWISCLKADFAGKYRTITHRDVKGALFNLQIEPNRFGDFWVEDDSIYLYCENEIASALISSFEKVANLNIRFEQTDFHEQTFNFETFKVHTSSLRLDSIVSELVHKSREKTKLIICKGNALVNYKTIEDCSFVCNNYDILSLKGFGRFQIIEINVNRKSGNYILTINRFV